MQPIDKVYIDEALVHLRKKLIKMNSLFDLTKELEEALRRNDDVPTQMLLKSRAEVMNEIDIIDEQLEKIIVRMPREMGARMIRLTAPVWKEEAVTDPNELSLRKVCDSIHLVVGKIVQKDKQLNTRVGGNNSFYHQQET